MWDKLYEHNAQPFCDMVTENRSRGPEYNRGLVYMQLGDPLYQHPVWVNMRNWECLQIESKKPLK